MRIKRISALAIAILVTVLQSGAVLLFGAQGEDFVSGEHENFPDESIREIIEEYFERQYDSYIENSYDDISDLVYAKQGANRNMLRWWRMLLQRRRLLADYDLCYVETEKFPYSIQYGGIPDDGRMEIWEDFLRETNATAVNFVIKGSRGKAYPPIMAVNAHHTMLFQEIDSEWKIVWHYFPGSARKFPATGWITIPTTDKMLSQLQEEFADDTSDVPVVPLGAVLYDPQKAVRYAKKYAEKNNPEFYSINDWIGNCQNFVSQCVWAGLNGGDALNRWLGDRMDNTWNGKADGTAAWAHVNSFWDYINSGSGLYGGQLSGAGELLEGDIVQTRQLVNVDEPDRFTHTLIVVDGDTLMLAQNTPASYVYYSDLPNLETRFVRPVYTRS